MRRDFLQPKTWRQRWLNLGVLSDSILALTPALGASVGGVKLLDSVPWLAWLSFIGGAAASLIMMCKVWTRNRTLQGDRELHALDGALHTLHAILDKNGSDLRICVFVPKPKKPDIAHQITDYVGVVEPYGRGRDLSCRCGVVGLAFRTGQAQYSRLPNNVSVVDHLVAAFGFDRSEASQMHQDRKSWAAMPVGAPNKVVAVIFLDSSDANFFGNASSSCRKEIEAAAIGVANFIART